RGLLWGSHGLSGHICLLGYQQRLLERQAAGQLGGLGTSGLAYHISDYLSDSCTDINRRVGNLRRSFVGGQVGVFPHCWVISITRGCDFTTNRERNRGLLTGPRG